MPGGHFTRAVLVQTLLIAIPAAILLMAGRAILAGTVFWSIFGLSTLRLLMLRRSEELTTLIVALTPFFNLLREFAFFNVVVFVLGTSLFFLRSRSPRAMSEALRRFRLLKFLIAFVAAQYGVSVYLTGNYFSNLRGFELVFAAFAIVMIARDRSRLATALAGTTISAIAIGAAMLPHIDTMSVQRLGIVMMDNLSLGNPAQLGTPLSLACLVFAVDSGGWVAIRYPLLRWPLFLAAFGLLALTTSREAWLIAIGGVIVVLAFGRRQRLGLFLILVVTFIGVQVLLVTPYGEGFEKGLTRTFSKERTTRSRTSGRSDQWIVAYEALTESPGSLIHGYGPGLSERVYARKSLEINDIEYGVGRRVPFHSFYMQIAVEAGLIGLLPVVFFLIVALSKSVAWTLRTGTVLPLSCLVSYVFIAATVSGYDTVSGIFLGLGLLSTGRNVGHGGRSSRPSHA